jgi:hypothetical protein
MAPKLSHLAKVVSFGKGCNASSISFIDLPAEMVPSVNSFAGTTTSLLELPFTGSVEPVTEEELSIDSCLQLQSDLSAPPLPGPFP